MDTKNQGTVKFFNSEKGFGFIKHDESDKETFVHVSGLINDIKEGDKVEFELQNGKKGMNAVNVFSLQDEQPCFFYGYFFF